MPLLSLCMIVKDEEAVLHRCLSSVQGIADEIIVVDTGSADSTKEIAEEFTDLIYDFPWCDDFAAARNFSFSKATGDFCMWLDADDFLLPEDAEKLRSLKGRLSSAVDVVMLPYCSPGKSGDAPDFWYYRERIVKNSPAYRWSGRVHEAIVPVGNILYEDVTVCHDKRKPPDSHRNLRILESMRKSGLSPRHLFYYGKELWEHGQYAKAASALEEFLQTDGWLENKLSACVVLSACYAALQMRDKAYRALLHGFTLDVPRAELCCALGNLFLEDSRFPVAAYWFEAALSCPFQPEKGGFVQTDCYGFLPHIQLCVCYDKMGDYARAEAHNEKAGEYRPDAEAYHINRAYFSRLRHSSNL